MFDMELLETRLILAHLVYPNLDCRSAKAVPLPGLWVLIRAALVLGDLALWKDFSQGCQRPHQLPSVARLLSLHRAWGPNCTTVSCFVMSSLGGDFNYFLHVFPKIQPGHHFGCQVYFAWGDRLYHLYGPMSCGSVPGGHKIPTKWLGPKVSMCIFKDIFQRLAKTWSLCYSIFLPICSFMFLFLSWRVTDKGQNFRVCCGCLLSANPSYSWFSAKCKIDLQFSGETWATPVFGPNPVFTQNLGALFSVFRWCCKHYNNLFGGSDPRLWTWGKDLNKFRRWADGCTGYPFVDAAMAELKDGKNRPTDVGTSKQWEFGLNMFI